MIGRVLTCNATHCWLLASRNETSMSIRRREPAMTGQGLSCARNSSGQETS
jgi:hypothetical protein